MATTLNNPTRVGPQAWKYTWSGTSPYYVYFEGETLFGQTTTLEEYIFEGSDYADMPPQIQVLDSTESATTPYVEQHPQKVTVQWRGSLNAEYYRVDQYVDSEWETYDHVPETKDGYYNITTDVLADSTTHTFRVVAVDDNGYDSEATSVSVFMVRHPDPPDVVLSYDEDDEEIDVTARA